jgi:hypothetical protein
MQRLMTQLDAIILVTRCSIMPISEKTQVFFSLWLYLSAIILFSVLFFGLVMRERKSFRSLIVFEYMLQLMTTPLGGFDLCWGHVM